MHSFRFSFKKADTVPTFTGNDLGRGRNWTNVWVILVKGSGNSDREGTMIMGAPMKDSSSRCGERIIKGFQEGGASQLTSGGRIGIGQAESECCDGWCEEGSRKEEECVRRLEVSNRGIWGSWKESQQAMLRSLDLMLMVVWSHGRILRTGVTWSDFHDSSHFSEYDSFFSQDEELKHKLLEWRFWKPLKGLPESESLGSAKSAEIILNLTGEFHRNKFTVPSHPQMFKKLHYLWAYSS